VLKMMKLSSYASNLEKEAKARYEEKISLINRVDPFGKVTEGEYGLMMIMHLSI